MQRCSWQQPPAQVVQFDCKDKRPCAVCHVAWHAQAVLICSPELLFCVSYRLRCESEQSNQGPEMSQAEGMSTVQSAACAQLQTWQ